MADEYAAEQIVTEVGMCALCAANAGSRQLGSRTWIGCTHWGLTLQLKHIKKGFCSYLVS